MSTGFTVTVHYETMSRRMQRLAHAVPEATDRGMRRMAEAIKAEFEITTFTWDTRPEFKITPTGTLGHYRVGTDNLIYRFVDQGTIPHVIEARNAPYLVFAAGSSPKTQPGQIGSYGGRPGNQWRKKKRVNHPGIRARHFRDTIRDRFRLLGRDYVVPEIEAVINGGGFGL